MSAEAAIMLGWVTLVALTILVGDRATKSPRPPTSTTTTREGHDR